MTTAARASQVHGYYALLSGLMLVVYPHGIAMLGITEPPDPWLRLFGAQAIGIGVNHLFASKSNDPVFYRSSVIGRLLFAFIVLIVVILNFGGPSTFLLAAPDVITALWTIVGLRDLKSATK